MYVKPEIKHNNSKLDFYLETEKDKIYVEVKEGSAFLTLSP
ncbi:DNA/RNA nuclease SfsA [Leptotrichia wadei]|nr:DNA/RNA nuclease SfsA [Leptotrichia wadei]